MLLMVMLLLANVGFAQPAEKRITHEDYIERWKDEAIRQMLEYGIPASISMAQGILESGYGNSALARYANNHFGIKCHNWDGPGFYQDDDKKNECFRKYESAEKSWEDHSKFLAHRGRYSFLFDLKGNDYKSWAKGLKKAGYATNPKYPSLLIRIIEQYDLHELDKVKKMPKHYPDVEEPDMPFLAERHKVSVNDNNIKYVMTRKGDTFFKIAKEFDMGLWQIYKYNDLEKTDLLHPGEIIYLQPKRNSFATAAYHTVRKGETMYDISQRYGVKLKKLYKKNNMRAGAQPYDGQKLSLQKNLK